MFSHLNIYFSILLQYSFEKVKSERRTPYTTISSFVSAQMLETRTFYLEKIFLRNSVKR